MHQAATGVAANHLHQCLLRSRVNPNGVGINGHCGQAMFPMLQASRTEEPTTQLKVCITGNGAARAYRTVSRVFLTNDQEAQLTAKFPGVVTLITTLLDRRIQVSSAGGVQVSFAAAGECFGSTFRPKPGRLECLQKLQDNIMLNNTLSQLSRG